MSGASLLSPNGMRTVTSYNVKSVFSNVYSMVTWVVPSPCDSGQQLKVSGTFVSSVVDIRHCNIFTALLMGYGRVLFFKHNKPFFLNVLPSILGLHLYVKSLPFPFAMESGVH